MRLSALLMGAAALVCALIGVAAQLVKPSTQLPPPPIPSFAQPPLPASTVQTHYNDTIVPRRCSCECGTAGRRERIVGGTTARPHEFPWLAVLSKQGRFYCAGSLLTPRHVLTAAHCLEGVNYRDVWVTLGEHERSSNGTSALAARVTRRVVNATRHSGFSLATFDNDIALLTLDAPVPLAPAAAASRSAAYIRPACLPLRGGTNYTDHVGVVAGWGRLAERRPTADTLQKVSVPIMSQERCRRSGYSRSRITDNMICAGYPQGKQDACQGDSGGPMHLATGNGVMEVIGLVSWGRGCARPNYPGVYTRIVNYLHWLDERLDGECLCSPPRSRTPKL